MKKPAEFADQMALVISIIMIQWEGEFADIMMIHVLTEVAISKSIHFLPTIMVEIAASPVRWTVWSVIIQVQLENCTVSKDGFNLCKTSLRLQVL